MTTPRFALALSVAGAALVAGCRGESAAPETAEPAVVRTALAASGDITEWIEIEGQVAPRYDRDAQVAPQVAGRIVFLDARVGQSVAEGAVVARVETAALDDELKAAQAAARRADADAVFKRAVAKRTAGLVDKGVASREEAEAAEDAAVAAESAQAEAAAALAVARRRRAWSEVRAPFTGVVVRVDRRVGDYVDGTAATPVAQIADAAGWEIVASAPAAVLSRLRSGQAAMIRGLDPEGGGASAEIAAQVSGVARAVDAATGAGEVRLLPRARPARVALGTPVRARIVSAVHRAAVLVPAAAIRMTPEGSAEVVVVDGGVAHVRAVETGFTENGMVEVVSGLSAGLHVVVEDPLGIEDGAALKEKPGPGPSGSAAPSATP